MTGLISLAEEQGRALHIAFLPLWTREALADSSASVCLGTQVILQSGKECHKKP